MTPVKTFFITGATGNIGGAVANSLLKNGAKVKVLVRNPDAARAQNLQSKGAEIIKGDLEDVNSFRDHLKEVDRVFSVQAYQYGVEKELKQGLALADLAKEFEVGHFVYSSVAGADLKTGIPHFESKFKIENHIKQLGLPYTFIRPTSLYENFLLPQVKGRILKGKLVSPINKQVIQQFITATDVGEIAAEIFQNKDKYLRKTITVGTEQLDMEQVAQRFSEGMGREIKYQKLPMLITRLVMGKDLYKMFSWINAHNATFMKDLEAFKKDNPHLTSLTDWIRQNFK